MIPELLGPAIDYYRSPRRFERFSDPSRSLPAGITELLAAPFHALSDEHLAETAQRVGATEEECRAAVPFFVKQALLVPDGDHYRTLGVSRAADRELIRKHYHYLMKLFHPDNDVEDVSWDDLYAPKINEAYNTLRDSQRRAEYDAGLEDDDGFNPGALQERSRQDRYRPPPPPPESRGGMSPTAWKVAGGLVVGVILLFVLVVANQSSKPQLRLGKDPQGAATSGGTASSGPSVQPVADAASTESDSGRAPARSNAGRGEWSLDTDRRIEEMVKSRVAQATTAVLGPNAGSRPSHPEPAADLASTRTEASARPAQDSAATAPEPSRPDGATPPEIAQDASPRPQALNDEDAPAVSVAHEGPAETVPGEPEPPAATMASTAAPVSDRKVNEDGTLLARTSTVPQPGISTLELGQLLDTFVATYELGDARAFADLFSPNARTTDASGRQDIHDLYAEFFARPEQRSMQMQSFKWNRITQALGAGEGVARITTTPLKGGRTQRGDLEIDLVVERTEGGLMITRLFYERR